MSSNSNNLNSSIHEIFSSNLILLQKSLFLLLFGFLLLQFTECLPNSHENPHAGEKLAELKATRDKQRTEGFIEWMNILERPGKLNSLGKSFLQSVDLLQPAAEILRNHNKSLFDEEEKEDHLSKHHRRRNRRRLPLGAIGNFFARLTSRGKVAASTADDVVIASGKIAVKNGDKVDDVLIAGGKINAKNLARGPGRGQQFNRRDQYRPYDPPSGFNPYTMPKDEARKVRSKALTGANLALAAGGVTAGIWYFSGENTTLFISIIIGIVLISLLLITALLSYCFLCRRKKRGYYAVNEEDILMAFLKKLFFYLFC